MKNTILKIAMLFILGFVFTSGLLAQTYVSNTASSVKASLEYKVQLAAVALEADGYTIKEVDATYLAKDDWYITQSTCMAGLDYTVLVVTEDGVKNIDIFIYDSKEKLVGSDFATNNDIITYTEFTMNRTSTMKFAVKNHESLNDNKAYQTAIIIAYR